MDAERWRVVEDLLARTLARPAAERGAFLEDACDDAALRDEVRGLVAAADGADAYFDRLAGAVERLAPGLADEAGAGPPQVGLVGRRVGPWRITGLLGRGGMGTVWRAERADGQFERTVALKLLSMGAAHPDTHRRFLAERQTLAGLEHPHIARLFDGGVTEDGTPYFVMELVDGAPLDVWCDARRLDVDGRLDLFLDVCDAVTCAHSRAVIHRDLKPANVLVAEGRVRLLDFGIAKLAAGGADATATDAGPLTPAYAAPEQVAGGAITTATDVYSLGVLLYELLVGASPYGARERGGPALLRAVCEEHSPAPSARAGQASTEVARDRGTTPPALARRLRGDLDAIVLTALRKDPAQRYPTVAALADDLRRHRGDLPVRARGDDALYRVSRFAVRHALPLAAAASVALAVAGVSGALWWTAARDERAAREVAAAREDAGGLAEQLAQLYASVDPTATGGEALASRRLLDEAVANLRASEGLRDATRADLAFAAGRVYRRIGAFDEARALLVEALDLRRALVAAPDALLSEVLYELGATAAGSGRVAEGVEHLREALAMALELFGPDHLLVAQIRFALASTQHDGGGRDAVAELSEAVRVFRARSAEPTTVHADASMALGDAIAVRGEFDEALALYAEALDIYVTVRGERHPRVADALSGLGMLRYSLGAKDEAIGDLRRALAIDRAAYGDSGHPHLARSLQNLGNVLAFEGVAEGIDLLEEAAATFRAAPSIKGVDFGFCLTLLGNAHGRAGDTVAAKRAYEEALDVFEAQSVPAMFRAETRRRLADLALAEGRPGRAVELLELVLDGYDGMLPEDHPRVVELRAAIAAALAR